MEKINLLYVKVLCGVLSVLFLSNCGTSQTYVARNDGKAERNEQVKELPDSLAIYLKDLTYVAEPNSFELKLLAFDKQEYEIPVIVIDDLFNPSLYTYGHGWYGFGWYGPSWMNLFYDPYWDPEYQGSLSRAVPFKFDRWCPRPFYAYGPGANPWFGPLLLRGGSYGLGTYASRGLVKSSHSIDTFRNIHTGSSSYERDIRSTSTSGSSYAKAITKSRSNEKERLFENKIAQNGGVLDHKRQAANRWQGNASSKGNKGQSGNRQGIDHSYANDFKQESGLFKSHAGGFLNGSGSGSGSSGNISNGGSNLSSPILINSAPVSTGGSSSSGKADGPSHK